MTYDIYLDIAEHRAELAHCFLSTRERADLTKRLAELLSEAEEQKAAWTEEA